ncbi:hypothetical protein BVX94_00160, partial [bacterium B17]
MYSIMIMVCCTSIAFSAKPPAQLAEIQKIYKSQLEKINKEYDKTVKEAPLKYNQNLTALEKTLQSKGDLQGIMAVRKERDRFSLSKEVTDELLVTTPKPLKKLQQQYMASEIDADINKTEEINKLTEAYLKRLEKVKKSLTVKGNIDEALLIQAEI